MTTDTTATEDVDTTDPQWRASRDAWMAKARAALDRKTDTTPAPLAASADNLSDVAREHLREILLSGSRPDAGWYRRHVRGQETCPRCSR